MRFNPASRRGFTLLEVMIVVGIAALILAISVPFVERTINRDAVYKAVHAIEDGALNARATAIFNNATTDLVIRPQDRTVQVRPGTSTLAAPPRNDDAAAEEDGDGRPRVRGFSRHAPKPYSVVLEEDVSIELIDVNFQDQLNEEETRVRFHPNGTSDEFTVVLKIGTTGLRKISLDVVTALPSVETLR